MISPTGFLPTPHAGDLKELAARLDTSVSRGVLGAGIAHRVLLAAWLANTSPAGRPDGRRQSISGESLAQVVGLSRAGVHKHVNRLRSLGFAVRSVPGAGYALDRPFDDLVVAEAVLPFLLGTPHPGTQQSGASWIAGLPYSYLPRCGSTNVSLKEAAERAPVVPGVSGDKHPGDPVPPGALPEGALVVTDEQTGGRGRLGRAWQSETAKDLTFSVLLRPSLAPAQAHLLSLAAALAVAEALEGFPGLGGRLAVKWPNDVLIGEDKVCGILLEGSIDVDRLQWAVAGIGLNVNSSPSAWMTALTPEEKDAWGGRPRPVSLRERLGVEVPRAPLLAVLLQRLTHRWNDLRDQSGRDLGRVSGGETPGGAGDFAGADRMVAALRPRDALLGRRVEVLAGADGRRVVVSGEAAGIGPGGELLVRRDSGEIASVLSGEVTLRTVNQSFK